MVIIGNVLETNNFRTQYGLYQEAVTIKKNDEATWNKAVFWVFDAPDIAHKPFEVC
jgi:hypothetical protein